MTEVSKTDSVSAIHGNSDMQVSSARSQASVHIVKSQVEIQAVSGRPGTQCQGVGFAGLALPPLRAEISRGLE
jgi:hypothetical protein